jgi:hypothetical protein
MCGCANPVNGTSRADMRMKNVQIKNDGNYIE